MKGRRDDKLLFMSDKESVQAVDELSAIGHHDFVRVTIECVQTQACKQRIAQGRSLAQKVCRMILRAGPVPCSPLINDQPDAMLLINLAHRVPMTTDERLHRVALAE